ncbi:MAG: radical SAM protein, partial [Gemmatimonadetes bacterium]|nr:radical SAM protein [Gemmatimonadota bacterium]
RRPGLPVLPHAVPAVPVEAIVTVPGHADTGAPRIGLVTLGCDKNTVDSERLLARLAGTGVRLAANPDEADVVIVNTCGFIDVAKEESVDTILEAVRLKAGGRVQAVIAMGCLVQRYKDELARALPEVDLFLGLTEMERLVPELRARGLIAGSAVRAHNMETPIRLLSTTARHTSHLKVSEGCDHGCAFCAIPLMRGKHRSTPIDVLVREAAQLEAAGVVELNLVSQDTTWYGRDLARGEDPYPADFFVGRPFTGMAGLDATGAWQPGAARTRDPDEADAYGRARRGLLPDLLCALLRETAIPWFRLFYMYPSGIQRELVDLIASEPRITPYIDMPIQHGADSVLRRMRRPERRATIVERAEWLRAAVPDVALRTTVIVGFPGETEDEFDALVELLEEVRFDHLGAFAYSVEENTPAATMPDPVADEVKRERLERLLDVQGGISQERAEVWLGRATTVLLDRMVGRDSDAGAEAVVGERGAIGRTARQAPEIDGVVHIADARGGRPGEFVRVRLVDALDSDYTAERIDA